MNQKYLFGGMVLAIVFVLGVSVISAHGFGNGFMNSDLTDEEKAQIQVQQESMRTAIEDGDYESWKSLMQERIAEMQEFVNSESNFNSIVEKHQEMKEKQEAMKESREEFCEENDCPNFENGEMGPRGSKGHFGMNADFFPPIE